MASENPSPTPNPPAAPPAGEPPKAAPAAPAISLETPGVREIVEREKAALQAKNAEILEEKRRLATEFDGLKEHWKGLDPEKVRLLLQRFESDEEAKLIAEGNFDEVIKRRVEARTKPVFEENTTLKTELAKRDEKIANMIFERDVRKAAEDKDLGVQPTAISDVISRARQVFKLSRDQVLVADVVGKNGEPLRGVEGLREWLARADVRKDAPHLFIPSKGGLATEPTSRGEPPRANPFLPGSMNLTEQAALYQRDPELARRLAAEAGLELALPVA